MINITRNGDYFMAFKTTIVYPNYVPPTPEVLGEITVQIDAMITAGKNTGGFSAYYDGSNNYTVERWAWIDEAACQEYFDMVLSYYDVQRTTEVSTIVTQI
jgi:hypothetical protein